MEDKKLKYKYEVAFQLGISLRTLSRYINTTWFDELSKLNYTKEQKLLLPVQIKFIYEMFCVSNE